jgi:hypothetical protein
MSDNRELTRVSNFIEKETSVTSIDEVYQAMLHLDEVIEKAQLGMDKLKAYLEKNNVRPKQIFPKYKKKIVFQEGKEKTEIDPRGLSSELTYDELMRVVKVNESLLKKEIQNGELLAQRYKDVVGKAKDSILVKKMTKKELKEYAVED